MADLYRGYSEGLLVDEEPTRFDDMYGTAATGLLFAPSAGISDIMGLAPDPARQGEYLPSFGANIREGNYLDAGLQALGGAGDVMMAGGALFPPAAAAGALMKAPRVAQVGRLISQNIDRNPKKLAKELRSQGLLGDITPEEFYSEFEKISDLKRKRSDARSGGDPLLTSAQYRPFRAKKMSLKKQIKESPMFNSWTKANRDRVLGSTDRQTANKEGSLATIEAIAREARKRGLKVYHTSKGKSGRASSRYIEMPDGNRVRISDHALPDTLEREHKRSVGVGIMSKDVVVDDWRNMSIDDYMSEILTPTGGRSDQQGEGIL